jgi:hypothetical protein
MVSASLLLELGQVESAQQCLGRAIFLQPDQAGLRIRIRLIQIRIQSGQWIRIQEGKNDQQKLNILFKSSCFKVLDGLF